jgi:hypothetical protein
MNNKDEDTIVESTVNISALGRFAWSKVVYMRYIMVEMAEYLQTCQTEWTLEEVIANLRERERIEPEGLHKDLLHCQISAYKRALEDLFRDSSGNPDLSLQITVSDLLRQIRGELYH